MLHEFSVQDVVASAHDEHRRPIANGEEDDRENNSFKNHGYT